MQIVGAHEYAEAELEVALAEDTKIRDIANAVFGGDVADEASSLTIDGRSVEFDIPVVEAGIGTGSVLKLAAPQEPAKPTVIRFDVLSGTGAGMSLALPAGTFPVGSATTAGIVLRSPGVRPHHANLEVSPSGTVRVTNADGSGGRPLHRHAVLRLGDSLVQCGPIARRRPPGSRMPGRRGTVSFNRPPRDLRQSPERPVELPEKPRPPSQRGPLSLVMLITPVVFGVAMAILIHPRMALFAALAPLTMLGHKIDGKRKKKKFARESAIENAENAERLSAELDARRVREVLRRRDAMPSVASLIDRVVGASTTLWERRPLHDDYMKLVCGYGYERWLPTFDRDPLSVADELVAAIRKSSALPLAPVPVDMCPGQVIGLSGNRTSVLGMARGLVCQAAALHGPSDLQIAVVTERPEDWDWAKWLPHTVADSASGRRFLASDAADVVALVTALTPTEAVAVGNAALGGGLLAGGVAPTHHAATDPATLLIVDVADLAAPKYSGIRNLLGGRGSPIAGLSIASSEHALPSVCTRTVLVLDRTAELRGGPSGDVMIAPASASDRAARTCARALARFDDPDRSEDGAELPGRVDLVDLIGFHERDPQIIIDRWQRNGNKPRPKGPLGVTEAGPLELDFISDGPHGLLAGTTGAGKSELLRTMVAAMAASVDPEHLNFVLIDYKGGSAFDACAGLPHTVGMVTDLDDHLAERALTCLEAELRYREHVLREVGADDLPAYLDLGLDEPLPRMVIVIDEFAAMAKELPDFMDALVDIAARGRSLGVHLLLATQRPAGVIRDNVRANTNMRIALRVQDTGDSMDVLNDRRAARIGRTQPGRGFVRLGPTEVVPFQTALVTGRAFGSADQPGRVPVRPFTFATEQTPFTGTAENTASNDDPTDLEILVELIAEAAQQTQMRPARLPWPDALPERVRRNELAGPEDQNDPLSAVIGLQDQPDKQRQMPFSWSPATGSLVAYGNAGMGTTTTLAAIALGLADRSQPEDLHMYVLDFDTGGLAPLADLPHVGGVVLPGERERQIRLIGMMNREVTRRKGETTAPGAGLPTQRPMIVLFIDGFDGFKTEYDIGADAAVRDTMLRIVTEGPSVGVVTVLSGMRINSLLPQMGATIPNKLVFRMADPLAAGGLGLRSIPHDLQPGRCYDVFTKREIQIALPSHDDLGLAVTAMDLDPWVPEGGPPTVDSLPTEVKASVLTSSIHIGGDEWFIPLGIGDTKLDVVGLSLAEGDHVLVAGESRSGRSTVLATIATVVADHNEDVIITAIAPHRSPLRDIPEVDLVITDPDVIDETLAGFPDRNGPQLLLVDDADLIEKSVVLAELATNRRPDLHVIAVGRRDLKRQYNHWANTLTKSRKGLWLQPSPGLDGDLWATPMPRRVTAGMPQGRGFLVSEGVVELVQCAMP